MKEIAIIGSTASGKTGLAIKLMKHFPIELISVDSALVYKGMDIGTAKPTADELEKAPHRLISFLDHLHTDVRYSWTFSQNRNIKIVISVVCCKPIK